jgi:hypothetical protein
MALSIIRSVPWYKLGSTGKICSLHRDTLWKVSTDGTIHAARKLDDRRDEKILLRGNSYNDGLKRSDTCVLAPGELQKR